MPLSEQRYPSGPMLVAHRGSRLVNCPAKTSKDTERLYFFGTVILGREAYPLRHAAKSSTVN
jgi:hypothetical protein